MSCLRRDQGLSILNPHYISFVGQLVLDMVKDVPKLPHGQILILSFYNEERKALVNLFRKLGLPDVRVKSVDSSQGSESSGLFFQPRGLDKSLASGSSRTASEFASLSAAPNTVS